MPPGSSKSVKAGSKPRPPLITPSASPPPNHVHSATSAPPAKRPRLGSVAPRSRSRATSVASSVPPDSSHELHYARKDSAQRLMDTWSQLAERYARPLDQDDIIDLRSKTLVLDHGSLRDTSGAIDFGMLTLNSGVDTQDEAPDDEGEEEFDELDMLNPEADISEQILSQRARVPPVREMDPADAADLQEFMELERKKREDFGDLEGDEVEYAQTYTGQLSTTEAEYEFRDETPIKAGRNRRMRPPTLPPSSSPAPSSESDDEFGSWKMKESDLVSHANDVNPIGSDDEGISLPPPSSSPGVPSSPIMPSPPLSRSKSSSAKKPAPRVLSRRQQSPDLEIVPVRVSPVKRRAAFSTIRTGNSLGSSRLKGSVPISSMVATQLQTPPRSTSSASLCRDSPSPDIVNTVSRKKMSIAAQPRHQSHDSDEDILAITPVRRSARSFGHQSEGSSSSARRTSDEMSGERQQQIRSNPKRAREAQPSPPPPVALASRHPSRSSKQVGGSNQSSMKDNSRRSDRGKVTSRAFSSPSPSCTDEVDHREHRGAPTSRNYHPGKRKRASSDESSSLHFSEGSRSAPSSGLAGPHIHYEQRQRHVTRSTGLYRAEDHYGESSSSSAPRQYRRSDPSQNDYDSIYYPHAARPHSNRLHHVVYPENSSDDTQFMIAQTLQTLQALMGGGIAPQYPPHDPNQSFSAHPGYDDRSHRSILRPHTPLSSSEAIPSRQWAISHRESRYGHQSSSPLPSSSPPQSSTFNSYGRRSTQSLPRWHARPRRVSFHTEVQHLSDPSESPNEAMSDPETRTRRSTLAQNYPVARTKKSYRATPAPASILRVSNHSGSTPGRTRPSIDTYNSEGYYSPDKTERTREHRRHPDRAHTPGPPDRR